MSADLVHAPDARVAILTSQPARPTDRRLAVVVVAVSVAFFAAAAPFARTPLSPQPSFIPAYQSALVLCDLITAMLLFEQLRYLRSRALLALACGYLFTAVIAIGHALTFPGLIAAGGGIGGPQTTAWLYMFWHAAFPLFVLEYALIEGEFARRGPITAAIAASVVAAAGFTALAIFGHSLLPQIMSGSGYTSLMAGVVGTVWALSVVALFVLWRRRRPHSILDVWLMVVMCAWIFEIALSAVLNGGRYDLGFYAGRAYGLLASILVLGVLLVEHGKLYRRLLAHSRALESARRTALDADRAKSTFLATMSHEIRTPMNGVMGMLELMAAGPLEGEQRTRLEIVRESGRSLLRILDDVLDMSRIEAGKLELHPEPVSIADLVGRVRIVHDGNASGKGLAFVHGVDARISVMVEIDPHRLGQILHNLVSNAIKFTEQGSVVIRADLVEKIGGKEIVRFTVSDTGCGVSAGDRAKLFQAFAQAGSVRRGGTGLGLSISRRLASLMNGVLEMDSEPGIGTKVTLTLPLMVSSVEARAAVRPPAPDPHGTSARAIAPSVEQARATGSLILVVDDHPVNRMVLTAQLASLGYASETAANGLEAIDRWRSGGHAAILTDCRMPEMHGYDLARHIRACESRAGTRRIPIIACTASALEGEATECFAAGMDDCLIKPIQLQALRRKLEQWASDPAIDRGMLDGVTEGDPARERQVLELFRQHAREDAEALRAAAQANDFDHVMMAAHRMKGSGMAIGATHLAECCTRLGDAARARDAAAIAAAMPALEAELARVTAHISSLESA